MKDVALEGLLAALSKHRRGAGRRYPVALRERATAWARGQRQKGVGVRRLSKELGMSTDTLRAWLGVAGGGASAKMKSVRVVERPAGATTPGGFRLVSVSGYRVEGLSTSELVTVLRELG
jgi:hypothetical protein